MIEYVLLSLSFTEVEVIEVLEGSLVGERVRLGDPMRAAFGIAANYIEPGIPGDTKDTLARTKVTKLDSSLDAGLSDNELVLRPC
jgi:hypothetical protein